MTAEATLTVIVNADDYGITHGVTQAIVELLDAGCIATSTVMMCAVNSERNQAPFRSDVDSTRLGLHLQITGGVPMRRGEPASFVDAAPVDSVEESQSQPHHPNSCFWNGGHRSKHSSACMGMCHRTSTPIMGRISRPSCWNLTALLLLSMGYLSEAQGCRRSMLR
jgi:hypothetical protein